MTGRGMTLQVTTTLHTEECFQCHVLFAFPQELYLLALERRGPTGRQFFCPNGHSQCYVGETEALRLKRELEATQRRLEWAEQAEKRLAEDNMDLAKSNRALKGAKTRLLRRVTNGVCTSCHRHFADVERHMRSKHADQVVTADQDRSSGGH